jgi:hypothetical protein
MLQEIFLSQLAPIEYESYVFAKKHLGDTFELLKSNAYLEWLPTFQNKAAVRIQKWWKRIKPPL